MGEQFSVLVLGTGEYLLGDGHEPEMLLNSNVRFERDVDEAPNGQRHYD